ncbi:MAG: hypothetical protein A3F84_12830 [Candidatus Handelsmanbacteria bacterium RIFCSPLOWO2_12_FULL_64_10]|uniref:Uncharacterized protein n=1 Tax=Handelsmanbacteria sp. (strain RIFCSPLOWO2_12_FULL_64_10) TaxID=1817868 RepID=A0A1F6CFS1_HANXR|nr:MAG: hypothetical protein A3F84_12830 [Candidatus Handelsmanbacteria bacterium RIFCSPLOWO2_12_FULL_64_10]
MEADVRSLRQDMTKLMVDVGEIKGMLTGFKMAFDQMDKRLTDLASQVDRRFSTIQWGFGLLLTLLVLVLGKLFLK